MLSRRVVLITSQFAMVKESFSQDTVCTRVALVTVRSRRAGINSLINKNRVESGTFRKVRILT